METEQVNTNLRLLAKTSLIVFIGVLLSKLFSYIYRIILVRQFGLEIYGRFTITFMLVTWFTTIAGLGLSEGALRFIALYRGQKSPDKIKSLLNSIFSILLVTGILSGLILLLLAETISLGIFKDAGLIIFLKFSSIAVPFFVLASFFLLVIRAYERISAYSFILNIFLNVVRVVLVIIFILIGLNSGAVILSFILSLVAMFLLSYLFARYAIKNAFGKHNLGKSETSKIIKQVFSYSFPLMFFTVLSTIFYWIDSFSLGFFKSTFAVGVYNTAVPIALLITVAPDLFMQLFMPLITREYSLKNINLIKELSKQVSKWILIINLPLSLLLIFFPGTALNILFGEASLIAANALRILAVGSLFSSLFVVSHNLVAMTGKSKLFLLNISLAAAVNLVLNIIFIPMKQILFIRNELGLEGAAIATAISMVLFSLLFFFQARKLTQIVPIRRKMLNVLLASAAASIILTILRSYFSNSIANIIMMTLLFLASYLLFILLFRALDYHDLMVIKAFRSKLSNSRVR